MRSEQEMMDLLLDFAKKEENIRAVLMNGSRVNPNAKKDVFQDFDIACLVRKVDPYRGNGNIMKTFGEIMILQTPEDMQDPPPEGDGRYTYLMQFMDGKRIDLSFFPLEQLNSNVDDSLTVVLLDKDNIIKGLPAERANGKAFSGLL